MGTDIPTEEEETETPIVEVTVEEAAENPEPEEVTEIVEAPDQTVIVEADAPGVSEEDTDRWVELERWKAEQEASVLELYRQLGEVHARADEVEVQAEVAEAEAADAFAEAEAKQESAPEGEERTEDEAPSSARVHPWFESRADRKARKSNN